MLLRLSKNKGKILLYLDIRELRLERIAEIRAAKDYGYKILIATPNPTAYKGMDIDYFYSLSYESKKNIIQSNFLASDGVNHETIKDIYSALYNNKIINTNKKIHILASRNISELQKSNNGDYFIMMHNEEKNQHEEINCERIILSTGYHQKLPDILDETIVKHIDYVDDLPVVNKDFSLSYDDAGKIFTMNMAKHSHGIGEPNLSIAAWRSSVIINSLLGYDKYVCPQESTMLTPNLSMS